MELNKVICGDCLEVMKDIPDKSIDLVLTDPPYGTHAHKGFIGYGYGYAKSRKYNDNWDTIPPPQKYFSEMLRTGKKVIIFGGNFFTDKLPVNGHWIVWDKIGEIKFQNPFSDCELAWTNINRKSIKKYIVIQQGFIAKEKTRFHPTQKPVKLLEQIIIDYSNENDLILDPFAGSGSTLVACKKLGRRYIGIDISEKYCQMAQQRLNQIPESLF